MRFTFLFSLVVQIINLQFIYALNCGQALSESYQYQESIELLTLLHEMPPPSQTEWLRSYNWARIDNFIKQFRFIDWIAGRPSQSDSVALLVQNEKLEFIDYYRLQPSSSFTRKSPHTEFQKNQQTVKDDWLRANQFVLDQVIKGAPITFEAISHINKIIGAYSGFKNDPGGGAIRRQTEDNYFQNSDRQFGMRANDVPLAMKQLIRWYESNQNRLHPIELATLFLQRFLTIHPFFNGNGRTGRLLVDWILISKGYPPPTYENGTPFMRFLPFQGYDYSTVKALKDTTRAIENTLQIIFGRNCLLNF